MAQIKITMTIEASSSSLAHAAIDCMDVKLIANGGRILNARLDRLGEEDSAAVASDEDEDDLEACADCEQSTAAGTPDPHECMSDHDMNIALVHALPEYKGWTAAWEYPGFLAFHRQGFPSVFATPDYHTRGEISVEVTNDATGHTTPRPNINWNRLGRTPEAFMALLQPVLDSVAPMAAPAGSVDDAIFEEVLRAMQPAEERGGPEGAQYVALMERIAHETQGRANRMREQQRRAWRVYFRMVPTKYSVMDHMTVIAASRAEAEEAASKMLSASAVIADVECIGGAS